MIIVLALEIFHHLHHHINKIRRSKNESIAALPEERNPLFYIYPICMFISVAFTIIWIFSKIFVKKPEIPLAGCFLSAVLLLTTAIVEMKHVDMYIDLSKVSDDELIKHPVFIHNFVMCSISIFCMAIYFIQAWILFDYYFWVRKQRSIDDVSDNFQDSDRKDQERIRKSRNTGKEKPGELDPIPTLDNFPSLSLVSQSKIKTSVQEEPVVLYCCFVDCYNYIKHKRFYGKPVHEFQVVHVM